jgi:hypothetical protein
MTDESPQPPAGYVMIQATQFRKYVADLINDGYPGLGQKLMDITEGDWTKKPPPRAPVAQRYRTELGSEYHVHADRTVSYHSRPPAELAVLTANEIEAAAAAGHLEVVGTES